MRTLVLVSGFPATGKTTLAEHIAPAIGFPLISKDVIKEALYRSFGATTVEDSHRLGEATYEVMFSLAEGMEQVVLEANFDPARSEERIKRLHPKPIEVFVRCDAEEVIRRYRARDRGAPHFDSVVADDMEERLRRNGQRPLAYGGPLLEVDTTDGLDEQAVISWVRDRIAET